ncbi:MAG: flagellar export chaperone FliS [Burkholderiaceae bacterium]|jgi:flagellar protein FliS
MQYGNFQGASAYANVGLATSVASASPLGLVILLYDGAIQAITNAKTRLASGDIAGKAKNLVKAVDIVNKGLNASLDPVVGGKMAQDLKALYDYMCRRLVLANLNNDVPAMDEVKALLVQLRAAWLAISETSAAQGPLVQKQLPRSMSA